MSGKFSYKNLEPNYYYIAYSWKTVKTKFGPKTVILNYDDHCYYWVPKKIDDYLNQCKKIDDTIYPFEIFTKDYKSFVKNNQKIKYLEMDVQPYPNPFELIFQD